MNSALTLFTSTLGGMYLRNVDITAHIREMKRPNKRMNITTEPLWKPEIHFRPSHKYKKFLTNAPNEGYQICS
jgi:hypothetical protein